MDSIFLKFMIAQYRNSSIFCLKMKEWDWWGEAVYRLCTNLLEKDSAPYMQFTPVSLFEAEFTRHPRTFTSLLAVLWHKYRDSSNVIIFSISLFSITEIFARKKNPLRANYKFCTYLISFLTPILHRTISVGRHFSGNMQYFRE